MREFPTEHEYLQWLIEDRFYSLCERVANPVQDLARNALKNGWDIDAATELEHLVKVARQRLWDERNRGSEILYWLKRDIELRGEGQTYPDLIERNIPSYNEEF